ncbi:hypothetical protein M405DRAFT_811557, partial [Rhizopogon salebrosus TDB-379]
MPDIPELFISSSAPAFKWLEAEHWARAMQSYDDAAQCFVERVVHCKCEEDKQHEFLSFEISSPTGSYRATVFVDRRVDVTQGVKQKTAVMSPSPSQTISNSGIPLANDLVWLAAKGGDSETSLNNQFGSYLALRTLSFPHDNNRPSAQHLATLLQTASMHERHYKLYAHQCYWFAHTVFESLKKLHPTSLLSHGHHHMKRSQYRGSNFPTADSVDEVCTEFQKAWGNFLDRKEEHQREQIAEREILVESGRAEGQAEREELESRLEAERLGREAEREAEQLEREAERLEREAERLEREWSVKLSDWSMKLSVSNSSRESKPLSTAET